MGRLIIRLTEQQAKLQIREKLEKLLQEAEGKTHETETRNKAYITDIFLDFVMYYEVFVAGDLEKWVETLFY